MSGTARPTEAALLLPNRVRDRCEPRLGITTTPVLGVEPLSNPVVEGRPRPLLRGPRVAVLHRVVVDVVRVPLEVILVPDQVLPEAGLEDAALALVLSTRRDRLLGLPPSEPSLGELLLDPSPPAGVVRVILGQRPQGVQVVRQQDDRVGRERPARPALGQQPAEDRTRLVLA